MNKITQTALSSNDTHYMFNHTDSREKLTFRRSVAQYRDSAGAHAAESRTVSTNIPESLSASSLSHSTDESQEV